MKIVINGTPITKKNSQRIVLAGKTRKIVPSQQYRQYERDSLIQIPARAKQEIDWPVNVQCVYYMPTRRRVDLVNLLESTCDILVAGGVLADDNCRIAAAHDGSRVAWDKNNPRVEITIANYHGITL